MAAQPEQSTRGEGLTERQRYQYLITQMKNERASNGWDAHWKAIAAAISPRRQRFSISDRNRGDRLNKAVINSAAGLALRTLRAGMMSGLSSPSRPWFRLTMPDPELTEFGPVKRWLNVVTSRMQTAILRTNFYKMVPHAYGDQGLYGTSAMFCARDNERLARFSVFPIGSYMLATGADDRVNTFAREVQLTAYQMVEQFGYDNVSQAVRNLWDRGNYTALVDVTHIITPNALRRPDLAGPAGNRFKMVYFENGDDKSPFLEERGDDLFRVIAPRWATVGNDVYGSDCPGMDALGDSCQLQSMEKEKNKAIQKMVNPPLMGPSALRNEPVSTLPGDITYVDVRDGSQGLKSIYDVRFPVADLGVEVANVIGRIDEAFFKNMWLSVSSANDSTERTAREIAERHEEKLLSLGPTLEGQSDELHDPVIDLMFAEMVRDGQIPEPPTEIADMAMRVEYISIMAQAQKMVAGKSLENFIMFTGAVASLKPDALDKFDADQAMEDAADMLGVNPELVVPDKVVAKIRDARAKKQAAMEAAAVAPNIAGAAKDMAAVDPSGNTALAQVAGRLTGG